MKKKPRRPSRLEITFYCGSKKRKPYIVNFLANDDIEGINESFRQDRIKDAKRLIKWLQKFIAWAEAKEIEK